MLLLPLRHYTHIKIVIVTFCLLIKYSKKVGYQNTLSAVNRLFVMNYIIAQWQILDLGFYSILILNWYWCLKNKINFKYICLPTGTDCAFRLKLRRILICQIYCTWYLTNAEKLSVYGIMTYNIDNINRIQKKVLTTCQSANNITSKDWTFFYSLQCYVLLWSQLCFKNWKWNSFRADFSLW
jgi:hypothetical protein